MLGFVTIWPFLIHSYSERLTHLLLRVLFLIHYAYHQSTKSLRYFHSQNTSLKYELFLAMSLSRILVSSIYNFGQFRGLRHLGQIYRHQPKHTHSVKNHKNRLFTVFVLHRYKHQSPNLITSYNPNTAFNKDNNPIDYSVLLKFR